RLPLPAQDRAPPATTLRPGHARAARRPAGADAPGAADGLPARRAVPDRLSRQDGANAAHPRSPAARQLLDRPGRGLPRERPDPRPGPDAGDDPGRPGPLSLPRRAGGVPQPDATGPGVGAVPLDTALPAISREHRAGPAAGRRRDGRPGLCAAQPGEGNALAG